MKDVNLTDHSNGYPDRRIEKIATAVTFVTNIPPETEREEVIRGLLACYLRHGTPLVGEGDRLEFEHEWPNDLKRQFTADYNDRKRVVWLDL
jgi:hypothetical protein